jgi:hypothetical protein
MFPDERSKSTGVTKPERDAEALFAFEKNV